MAKTIVHSALSSWRDLQAYDEHADLPGLMLIKYLVLHWPFLRQKPLVFSKGQGFIPFAMSMSSQPDD